MHFPFTDKFYKTIFILTISLLVALSFIGCTEEKTAETNAKIEKTEAQTQPPIQTSAETEQEEPQIQTEEATTSTETETETETTEPPIPYFDPSENPDAVYLEVKNIMQMPLLPNGCEVTSLAIVLNYLGYDIDHFTLYCDYLPRTDFEFGDPWTAYIGEATDYGLGCYAPCIVETANMYLSMAESELCAKDVSYQNLDEYTKYIDEGKPVIMWGMVDMFYEDTLAWVGYVDGQEVVWHARSHCLVMIGYTEDEYIFCDPLVGIVSYNKYSVLDCFTAMYKQACIIE